MDQKQKQELRFLLKARKRAEKVLAEQEKARQEKLNYEARKEANRRLMEQYAQELTVLARQSGILDLAEQAALKREGRLIQQLGCYVDYGLSTSCMQRALVAAEEGNQAELRAAYLSLRIVWGQPEALKEAEIRVHRGKYITFHHLPLPIFPFIWRLNPQLLPYMLEAALAHPRPCLDRAKKDG